MFFLPCLLRRRPRNQGHFSQSDLFAFLRAGGHVGETSVSLQVAGLACIRPWFLMGTPLRIFLSVYTDLFTPSRAREPARYLSIYLFIFVSTCFPSVRRVSVYLSTRNAGGDVCQSRASLAARGKERGQTDFRCGQTDRQLYMQVDRTRCPGKKKGGGKKVVGMHLGGRL